MKTIHVGLILISAFAFGCASSQKAIVGAPSTRCDSLARQPVIVPELVSMESIFIGGGPVDIDYVNGFRFHIDLPGIINTPGLVGVIYSSSIPVSPLSSALQPVSPFEVSRSDMTLIDDTTPTPQATIDLK